MKAEKYLSLIVSVILFLTMTACNGGGSSSSGQTTAATVNVGFNSAKHLKSTRMATTIVELINSIASITLDVSRGSDNIIQGAQLTNNNGTWSLTLHELPVGEPLIFTGRAYDSSHNEIFAGTTSQTLSGENDVIVISMAPTQSTSSTQLPIITRIGRPASVAASATVPVSISMSGNEGETLTYEITPAINGGTFNVLNGSIALNGAFATVVIDYTAPAASGMYTHSVKVTNSIGNSVETAFDTNVSGILTSPEVNVQFGPLVTNIGARRSGTEVTFAAVVSDLGDTAALTYSWSTDTGLYFADPSTNPAILQGYDENITGNVYLTVTNGLGASATVTYVIKPRQFPNSVISNIVQLPQSPFTPDLDDCRYGSVSGNIATLVTRESEVQQDLNNDGDLNDEVLGYVDVQTRSIVNAGVAVRQNSIAIDGDIIVFQYPGAWNGYNYDGTMGWYSISANEVHDTGIVPFMFGREHWGSTRIVSSGKIAYLGRTRDLTGDDVSDVELNIYDTATGQNAMTGVLVGPTDQQYSWYWRDYVPSFNGNLVAYVGPAGTIEYYDVVSQVITDTGVAADRNSHPTIDSGFIVFNYPSGVVGYYDMARDRYTLTQIPVNRNYDASISNGIIAAAIEEDDIWGDLNGSGVIGDDDSGIIVLYDIPTGRMVSTGVPLCCGPELVGWVIAYDYDSCDQWYLVIDDSVKRYFGRL